MLKHLSLHFHFSLLDAKIMFANNLCGVPVFSVCRFLKYYGQILPPELLLDKPGGTRHSWLSSFTLKHSVEA